MYLLKKLSSNSNPGGLAGSETNFLELVPVCFQAIKDEGEKVQLETCSDTTNIRNQLYYHSNLNMPICPMPFNLHGNMLEAHHLR
jgi:hypothetical protein